jgi:GAF domain-containing protein
MRGEELIAVRSDGGAVSILSFPTPLFDEHGAITGAVNVLFDITDRKSIETALHAKTERIEDLDSIVRSLSSDIPLDKIVQLVTDSATRLSGAKFGAFFYNVIDEAGESFQLFTLSGAPRSAFETFGMPRNTAVFSPTFSGERTVRTDDIQLDSRYGKSGPHFGMPEGHLPVRSYLAVPVLARSGEVLGLFFGHEQAGVFSQESEQIVRKRAFLRTFCC